MKTKTLPYITLSKRDMGLMECIRDAYAPLRKKKGKRTLSDLEIIRGSLVAHVTLLADNGMVKLKETKSSEPDTKTQDEIFTECHNQRMMEYFRNSWESQFPKFKEKR